MPAAAPGAWACSSSCCRRCPTRRATASSAGAGREARSSLGRAPLPASCDAPCCWQQQAALPSARQLQAAGSMAPRSCRCCGRLWGRACASAAAALLLLLCLCGHSDLSTPRDGCRMMPPAAARSAPGALLLVAGLPAPCNNDPPGSPPALLQPWRLTARCEARLGALLTLAHATWLPRSQLQGGRRSGSLRCAHSCRRGGGR